MLIISRYILLIKPYKIHIVLIYIDVFEFVVRDFKKNSQHILSYSKYSK